ncbi:hypothetical protein RB601_001390 [Gaeumannomyces tritici]
MESEAADGSVSRGKRSNVSTESQPLDLDRREIRLVRLRAAVYISEPIHCDLLQIPFGEDAEDGELIPYEALSWVWDNNQGHGIIVDGREPILPSTLRDALASIRLFGQDRILWIDAICINWANQEEITQQITLIPRIFERAESVIVWLGPETPDTRMAMRWLRDISRTFEQDARSSKPETNLDELPKVRGAGDSEARDKLSVLCKSTWFTRLWSAQDVANARRVTITYGRESVSSRAFVMASIRYFTTFPEYVKPMLELMPGPLREESRANGGRHLFSLVRKFFKHRSTSLHDKVYALVQVSDDARYTRLLEVDYEEPVEELHARTLGYFVFPNESMACRDEVLAELNGRGLDDLPDSPTQLANVLLRWAIETNRPSLLAALVRERSDIDINGSSSAQCPHLCLLARRGDINDKNLARTLLERDDIDANCVYEGDSALNLAVNHRSLGLVIVLASRPDIDIWHIGSNGMTPLESAWTDLLIMPRNTSICEALLRNQVIWQNMDAMSTLFERFPDIRQLVDGYRKSPITSISPASPALQRGLVSPITQLQQHAREEGDPSIMRTMIEDADENPNFPDGDGEDIGSLTMEEELSSGINVRDSESLLEVDVQKHAYQDSGYGSTSRVPTLETSSRQSVFGITELIEPQPSRSDLDDDVRSMVSDNDDIASQATDETTAAAFTGKTLIRTFLSDQPRFMVLCEKASSAMGDERFVQNMRRLLKSFHKNLLREASTEGEKAVAKLLRSRQGRLRISRQLVIFLKQEQEGWDGDRIEAQVAPREQRGVEIWLRAVAGNPEARRDWDPTPPTTEEPDHAGPSSDDETDIEEGEEEFPHISELRRFLQRAESYERLLEDFELMFLPPWLTRVLQSVPRRDISLSKRQDTSVANTLKAWVEDHTQVRWDWWPFERRRRTLRDDQSHIFWKCSCGKSRWKEISAAQVGSVRQILDLSRDKPDLPTKCLHTRARSLSEIFSFPVRRAAHSPATGARSSAAQRYTPSGSSPTNPATAGSASSQGTEATGSTGSLGTLTLRQHGLVRTAESTIDNKWWILVGVQAGWPSSAVAPISQFGLDEKNTDSDFFRKLKQCYEGQRGWWRLWFLIWQLDYCEVTRFRQIAPTLLARERSDLPRKDEYCYDPRPDDQDATNPPIEYDVFQACYYSCPPSCIWSAFHHCIPDQTGTENLVRIPKRTKRFGEDQRQAVWGLEPIFAVSFFRVVLYHFLILVGPFAYFAAYHAANPEGIQNAAVPASIVLSFLSVFWAVAGLSPVRGKRDQAG